MLTPLVDEIMLVVGTNATFDGGGADGGPAGAGGRLMKRFRAARAALHAALQEHIERRRRSPATQNGAVLAALVAARGESGAGLSDEEIRDQLMTMILAGHETTASSITWALLCLQGAPRALRALVAGARRGRAGAPRRATRRIAVPAGDVSRDAAAAAGDPGRVATGPARVPARRSRVAAAGVRHRLCLSRAPPSRVLPRSGSLSPGALPRAALLAVRVLPLRRRRASLHRDVVRAAGDADRARHAAAQLPLRGRRRRAGPADTPRGHRGRLGPGEHPRRAAHAPADRSVGDDARNACRTATPFSPRCAPR